MLPSRSGEPGGCYQAAMTNNLRRIAAVAVAATLAVGTLAAPASANTGGTINSGGSYVNVRSGPGTGYGIVGTLAQGTGVSVYCVWPNGTPVSGPYGTTSLWDEIGNNRWVTDAFVDTQTNDAIAMPCAGGNGQAFGPQGNEETDVFAVPGCYFVNSRSGTNFGARSTPTGSWPQFSDGCSNWAYVWTYGNGSTASGYKTVWGYFPGAYATCQISVQVPFNSGGTQYTFDRSAHYQVLTNKKLTILSTQFIDQQAKNGTTVWLGSFQADGTGYLGVQLDDYSGSVAGTRVTAQQVTFICTSSF